MKTGSRDREIAEPEKFFQVTKLPAGPLKPDQCITIADVELFINSHPDTVKAQNGNTRYRPYMERLNELKEVLTVNLN